MDGDGDGGYGGYGRDYNEYNSTNQDYNSTNQNYNSTNQDSYSGFIDTSDDKYKDDEVESPKRRLEDPEFEIIDEEETHPDGAIPRIVLASLSDSGEKPQQNGDAPSSPFLKESSLGNFGASEQDVNNGCNGGDCMYYTLMCCECSIL